MALRIVNITTGSEPEDEYIMMKAHTSANLADYALVNRAFLTKEPDKKIWHYNFPNGRIKKGEFVLLVSGVGDNKKYVDIEGDTIHKFYWNSAQCIWDSADEEAVIIRYQIISEYMVHGHSEETNNKTF